MAHPSDDELRTLMRLYQEGDEQAFRELHMRTAPGIERYLRRWCETSRTGDLTQDVFLQVHRARRTYRPEMPLAPWLFAIARHVAMQYVRTRGRRVVEVQGDCDPVFVAIDSTEDRLVEQQDLAAAMKELSDAQREAVWLSDIEGFSSAEVALITGVSEGTVRVRLHRARQKLKETMNAKRSGS